MGSSSNCEVDMERELEESVSLMPGNEGIVFDGWTELPGNRP